MSCCMKFGSCEDTKPEPVRKHFTLMFQIGDKFIGFTPVGSPHHISEPITKMFKGIAYIYLCTRDGSVYSTNKLEVFEKGGE